MSDPLPEHPTRHQRSKPLRLLVVMPSWVGDCVMATPALRLLRDALPGSFIGALARPGIDELLEGSTFFDEIHVDRARGMMGPKRVAAKLRPRAYDTALLFTNSFSTALMTRLAFIPRRVGYDRDARGLLLTDRLKPQREGLLGAVGMGDFACVPAVEYYLNAARHLVLPPHALTPPALQLDLSPTQEQLAAEVLHRAGVVSPVSHTARYVVLNPGGNNPAKRWPPERFAQLAAHLVNQHALHVLVSGSPNEQTIVDAVVTIARHTLAAQGDTTPVQSLIRAGITLGSLKGVLKHAALLVTNDTGPRHIAAAFNTPTLTLFGPTDPRWTTLPVDPARHRQILADPSLPPTEVADDHPERCRIDRIPLESAKAAADEILALPGVSRSI